ncbi:MAG TPA: spore germination protein GerPE [Bacillales bacterium]|nr:spore germination protein GerPE [Bacillales bacterium]
MRRLSLVDWMKVRSVSSSATLQIGDSETITPYDQVLAVQREFPVYSNSDFDFQRFDFFTRPLPPVPAGCGGHFHSENRVPIIKVGAVDIHGVAASSVVQVGSTRHVFSSSRVKQIRQFFLPLTEEQYAYFYEDNDDNRS